LLKGSGGPSGSGGNGNSGSSGNGTSGSGSGNGNCNTSSNCTSCPNKIKTIVIRGSFVVESIIDKYNKQYLGDQNPITVNIDGRYPTNFALTGPGTTDVLQGYADLGLASAKIANTTNQYRTLNYIDVGTDYIVIFVNPAITALTDISKAGILNILNTLNTKTYNFYTYPVGSGTRNAFEGLLGISIANYSGTIEAAENAIVGQVAADPKGISFDSFSQIGSANVKVLTYNGVSAGSSNYGLQRDLYVYYVQTNTDPDDTWYTENKNPVRCYLCGLNQFDFTFKQLQISPSNSTIRATQDTQLNCPKKSCTS